MPAGVPEQQSLVISADRTQLKPWLSHDICVPAAESTVHITTFAWPANISSSKEMRLFSRWDFPLSKRRKTCFVFILYTGGVL